VNAPRAQSPSGDQAVQQASGSDAARVTASAASDGHYLLPEYGRR